MATGHGKGRGGACGLHFLARRGWQAGSFLSSCVAQCLGNSKRPGKCLPANKEYPLTWRPHLFRRRAASPRYRGHGYIFVKIFKRAMHRPKTDTRGPCLFSALITIGQPVVFPSQANFSFIWDGRPRRSYGHVFSKKNETPVSLDRYIARMFDAFLFCDRCLYLITYKTLISVWRICIWNYISRYIDWRYLDLLTLNLII